MRWEATVLASGLLAAVQAAPRLFDQAVEDVPKNKNAAAAAMHVADGLYARFHAQMTTMPPGCPTASVIVSTTTVDVTVYITEAAAAEPTEPCPDDESTTPTPTKSEAAKDVDDAVGTISQHPRPEETGAWNTTTSAQPQSATSAQPNSTVISATLLLPTAGDPSTPAALIIPIITKNTTIMTTEPCTDSTAAPTSTSSPSAAEKSSSTPSPTEALNTTTLTATHSSTLTLKISPVASTPTTTCLIDTSMTPVTKAPMSSTPTSAAHPPTKTVCEQSLPSGSPDRDTAYCGVKGAPAGVYFIAEFIEERPGVPVTEEGCYQFCDSVMEDTKGCQSYRFFNNELGAPRCDLYGMPVSYAVKDLDASQSGKWFDLACGCPTSESWLDSSMPQHRNMSTTQPPSAPKPTSAAEPSRDHLLDVKLGPLSIGL